MHQIASSILSFLLSPFNWVVVLIIMGLFLRKSSQRKISRITALCIFIIFGNQWLLDLYAKEWQPLPVAINNLNIYSCGIVPGGFGSPDGEGDGSGYFNATADRFIQAVKLYKLGKINHILINGGNGKNDDKSFPEGLWAKNEMITMGIPDSVIFSEDKSNSTSDNAIFAKQILDSLRLTPPYLLISSAYHIPRAALIFKNAGIATVPFPCNYIEGRSTIGFWSFLPRPSVLSGWDVYLKETTAYLWYRLKK